MATYSVDELLTDDEREDFYKGLDEADAFLITAFVKQEFPAVFDQAAAKVGRVRAQVAEIRSKQEGTF